MVVAVGFFDGVHRGHQALVRRAVGDARQTGARAGVMTFEPHPLAVLQPGRAVDLLTTEGEKEDLLRRLGVDDALFYPFSRGLAGLSPEEFAGSVLKAKLGAVEVVVGYNFTFGSGGAGRFGHLRRLGEAYGFRSVMIPPVRIGGVVVSSSIVREKLLSGEVQAAERLLGYPYFVEGVVEHGAGRGQGLGFATANVAVPEGKLCPGDGVYVTDVLLAGEEAPRPGVTAVGAPVTFGGEQRQLEVHLLNYAGDLYGGRLRLAFRQRLRPMRRFPSADDLRAQIAEDRRLAGELWPSLYRA